MRFLTKTFTFIPLAIFISCTTGNKENKSTIDSLVSMEKEIMKSEIAIQPEELELLIGTIPPPLEISSLISGKGFKYNREILHSLEDIKHYNDSYRQAFFLGIYGTDLGYTQMCSQIGDGIAYFDAVYSLARELKIETFFDQKLIRKFSNNDNIDSLLNLTTKNFEQINQHFTQEKTPQLSIMILSGGWIESLNLLAETYKKQPSEYLKERIAEQQITMEVLLEILNKYDHDVKLKTLKKNLEPIIHSFAKIEIIEKELKDIPEHVWGEDGTLTITPSIETKVIVDKETFNELLASIISVRNTLIL